MILLHAFMILLVLVALHSLVQWIRHKEWFHWMATLFFVGCVIAIFFTAS
jgi:hypothetical protein